MSSNSRGTTQISISFRLLLVVCHLSTDIATLWVLSVSTAEVGPNFRVADQTGVLRVALCFATSRLDTLENTWKDEVFRVFSQSF